MLRAIGYADAESGRRSAGLGPLLLTDRAGLFIAGGTGCRHAFIDGGGYSSESFRARAAAIARRKATNAIAATSNSA
jgi:hypothetical protein